LRGIALIRLEGSCAHALRFQLPHDALRFLRRRHVADGHIRALIGERVRDGNTESARGTRDQRDFAGEVFDTVSHKL
jgi:hypothetical protein